MREKILLNERFGVVEISKTGIITGHNRYAVSALSPVNRINKTGDIRGLNIEVFTHDDSKKSFDLEIPARFIFSVKGIKHIDTIYYKETESAIVRFVQNNEALSPFFNVIQLSSTLYIELDTDLNIIFATDWFWQISGVEKSLFCGEGISVFTDKKNTGKINSTLEIFNKNIVSLITLEDIQFTFNGTARLYDLEITPVNDVKGSFAGIICHLIDRSYIRKCREMSRSMRRMSAVANFAGGIAHDYNNALTAVLGNLSLAKMDVEKGSELEELLNDAESAGLRIKILTERLGLFSRGMKPVKTKTDIKKLIENITPEIFSDYKGHYKITVQDNLNLPEIDRELISEALSHIIENAIDAVEGTDGNIIIEAEEIQVQKESVFREITLVSGRYVLISVKDNGSGIDPYSYNEIFDPYVTTKIGREGLGLALAYTIIKRHRGFISVEPSENGGSVFSIFLPLF